LHLRPRPLPLWGPRGEARTQDAKIVFKRAMSLTFNILSYDYVSVQSPMDIYKA
jgi:hypothetical protein